MSNGIPMFGVSDARIFDSNGFDLTIFLVQFGWVQIHSLDTILIIFQSNKTSVVRIDYLLSQIKQSETTFSQIKSSNSNVHYNFLVEPGQMASWLESHKEITLLP